MAEHQEKMLSVLWLLILKASFTAIMELCDKRPDKRVIAIISKGTKVVFPSV